MNFLLRAAPTAAAGQPSLNEPPVDTNYSSRPAKTGTLEGLIAEDPYLEPSTAEDFHGGVDGIGGGSGVASPSVRNESPILESHSDVTEAEGWITIPFRELSDNWSEAPNIKSFRPLDRSFVFPGEQIHILACLSAKKQDTEIITPFKVAAVMNKNGSQDILQNGENSSPENCDPKRDFSASESLLRMEDHKRQTEILLQKFRSSHFFVRFAKSGEPLWSKRSAPDTFSSEVAAKNITANDSENKKSTQNTIPLSAVIDRGNFDASVSGGAARNAVECCALSNGDIVVLLQVNVSVDSLRDSVLEILQFEKYEDKDLSSENQNNLVFAKQDPCKELLKWLFPLDNVLPPPTRPLSPPHPPLSVASSNLVSTSQKSTTSATSGSQLFSFGHFRSYSMSSLPQESTPPAPPAANTNSKPNFEPGDWERHSSQILSKSQKSESEGILSFRGVSLEPERFSVRCGLEGIYIPGRRWRRKIEIIQPLEIHSFAADCNTYDLLCVQIKNVSPAHTPDIVVYLDSITIVYEEASKGGPPMSLPIACIEAGNDHSLPNLGLRRGEEHSFILKPTTPMWKNPKALGERSQSSRLQSASVASSLRIPSKVVEGKKISFTADQYAVLVSCRCNYTESRLFFKQKTSWRPRISRDLMISVASEMSRQAVGPNGKVPQLPVQVLTLQASNLTQEDLTLTVLAPASFTSSPSVLSLNSSPKTPLSPLVSVSELTGRVSGLVSGPLISENQKQSGDGDVIPSNGLGCSHLWLQSRVPLGCVPSQSTATIKLELLPLTDGIITLDTLQIDIKEKGVTYIPEHSLKINATSSIATGIV